MEDQRLLNLKLVPKSNKGWISAFSKLRHIKFAEEEIKTCLDEVDGCVTIAIFAGWIGTVFEEKATDIEFALCSGLVKGCEAPEIGDIHIGAVLN